MTARKRQDGRDAEERAERYLLQQGLTPVARNYRCKVGEIDLVMQDHGARVFVEVRLRRHSAFGGPLASVDRGKQQRLIRAAQHYLQHTGWTGPCRFDVIGIGERGRPEWIRDAFGTDG